MPELVSTAMRLAEDLDRHIPGFLAEELVRQSSPKRGTLDELGTEFAAFTRGTPGDVAQPGGGMGSEVAQDVFPSRVGVV